MSGKVMTLHMTMEGNFLQEMARQQYWFEDNEKNALDILDSLVGITKQQKMDVINGDKDIVGRSICEDPECHQCKGIDGIQLVESDGSFKVEIIKRRLWLNEGYWKIGQHHVKKSLIQEYA